MIPLKFFQLHRLSILFVFSEYTFPSNLSFVFWKKFAISIGSLILFEYAFNFLTDRYLFFCFCIRDFKVYNLFHIIKAACFSETDTQELLLKLNDSVKSPDKNVRTRALWVLSKQTFPAEVIGKVVSMVFVYIFLTTCHLKN